MTDDQIWLRQRHDLLADEIQRSRLFFAEAQDHRKAIAAPWNDSCANEMNGRFLNPLVEEATASLESMRLQHAALLQCGTTLVLAFQFFVRAAEASAAVQTHIDESAAVFRTIESFLNQAISEQESADSHSDKANRLIDEAERAGNNAQSEASYRS